MPTDQPPSPRTPTPPLLAAIQNGSLSDAHSLAELATRKTHLLADASLLPAQRTRAAAILARALAHDAPAAAARGTPLVEVLRAAMLKVWSMLAEERRSAAAAGGGGLLDNDNDEEDEDVDDDDDDEDSEEVDSMPAAPRTPRRSTTYKGKTIYVSSVTGLRCHGNARDAIRSLRIVLPVALALPLTSPPAPASPTRPQLCRASKIVKLHIAPSKLARIPPRAPMKNRPPPAGAAATASNRPSSSSSPLRESTPSDDEAGGYGHPQTYAFPPFPPLQEREVAPFLDGIAIALSNITEDYEADRTLSLREVVGELRGEMPEVRDWLRRAKLVGAEYVYEAVVAQCGSEGEEEEEDGEEEDARSGDEEPCGSGSENGARRRDRDGGGCPGVIVEGEEDVRMVGADEEYEYADEYEDDEGFDADGEGPLLSFQDLPHRRKRRTPVPARSRHTSRPVEDTHMPDAPVSPRLGPGASLGAQHTAQLALPPAPYCSSPVSLLARTPPHSSPVLPRAGPSNSMHQEGEQDSAGGGQGHGQGVGDIYGDEILRLCEALKKHVRMEKKMLERRT